MANRRIRLTKMTLHNAAYTFNMRGTQHRAAGYHAEAEVYFECARVMEQNAQMVKSTFCQWLVDFIRWRIW